MNGVVMVDKNPEKVYRIVVGYCQSIQNKKAPDCHCCGNQELFYFAFNRRRPYAKR